MVNEQGAWQPGLAAFADSELTALLVQLKDSFSGGLKFLFRERLPQIGHNAIDLGHGCADAQMATPVTAFLASESGWPLLSLCRFDCLFGQHRGLIGNLNDLERGTAASKQLKRLQALRTPGIKLAPAQACRPALHGRIPVSSFGCTILSADHVRASAERP